MATLTITIPDAKVPFIRAAFRIEDPPGSGQYRLPTVVEVEDRVKTFIRKRTEDFAVNDTASTAASTKRAELEGEIW